MFQQERLGRLSPSNFSKKNARKVEAKDIIASGSMHEKVTRQPRSADFYTQMPSKRLPGAPPHSFEEFRVLPPIALRGPGVPQGGVHFIGSGGGGPECPHAPCTFICRWAAGTPAYLGRGGAGGWPPVRGSGRQPRSADFYTQMPSKRDPKISQGGPKMAQDSTKAVQAAQAGQR